VELNTLVLATRLSALEVLHNICNMGTSDLPDMYARSPQAFGIHIRQITRAHVTTIKYTTILKNCTIRKLLIPFSSGGYG